MEPDIYGVLNRIRCARGGGVSGAPAPLTYENDILGGVFSECWDVRYL